MGFSVGDNYVLDKNYKVTIHGTSNHDDWDETVGKVTGNGIVSTNKDESFDLNELNIKMDVYSITSKSSIMNNKTYSALKADTYANIIFELTSPLKSVKAASAGSLVSAKGSLSIAGVKKLISVQVKVFMPKPGTLVFEGVQSIKMTDFGISPPTALFGMLTTGDVITLHFKTSFVNQ
ncbi:MAG: YceI family protein [Bacteroidia bacterium]